MPSNPLKLFNTISMLEKIMLCIAALLFIAQPFSGGPRVPLFILAASGIYLYIREKRLRRSIGINQLGLIVLLFGIPGILSFWNTYNLEKTTAFALIIPAFFFAGVTIYSLLRNERCFKLFTAMIAIASCAWIIDSFIQFIFGVDVLGVPTMSRGQITGPFVETTHMGMLLTVVAPVTMKWLGKFSWWYVIAYLASLGFILVLTGVRTDWVTLLVGIVLFFAWVKNGKILLLFVIAPVLLIVGLLAITNSKYANTRVKTFKDIPTTYEEFDELSSYRLEIWKTAWNMVTHHPLTGVGAKSFNFAFSEHKSSDRYKPVDGVGGPYHAHHPWVTILAERGFIGFICFIGVIVLMFGFTARSKWGVNLYAYPWLLSFVLIINPVNSMPPLFKMWWFPIVLLVIVAHLADLKRNNAPAQPSNDSM